MLRAVDARNALPHTVSHTPAPRNTSVSTSRAAGITVPPKLIRRTTSTTTKAARSYRVGAYRRPPGWVHHRWGYGQILPRAYWAAPYILADYWLFALEVPPVGFEWVRDDTDAILVNVATGQIIQVEYGVFG
jgi:Ni/Co efflux regulator RcnB